MTLRLPPSNIAWHVAASLVAVGVAAWSLTSFLSTFDYGSAVCEVDWDFALPLVLFSISLIWLFSEALIVASAGVLERPLGRPPALMLGLLIHFLIGTIGWLIYPNVGYENGGWSGLPEWIPMWIAGLLFKVGHLTTCQ